jgi:hypothetical protein
MMDLAGLAGVPDNTWSDVCRHCHHLERHHIDTKCPFDTLSFFPMTVGEVKAYLNDQISLEIKWTIQWFDT